MSTLLAELKASVEAAIANGLDHTVTTKFEGAPLPEPGTHPARLIGYVELGTHAQPEFQGQKKKPARELRLFFEVFGKANVTEENGVKRGRLLTVRLTLSLNSKAKFKKLFNAMLYGRPDVKGMPAMLDEVFMLTISHKKSAKGDKVYANIRDDNGWTVAGPFNSNFDPTTGEMVAIDMNKFTPPASMPHKLFLVDEPAMAQWNSIFIEGEGERTIKGEDGTETTVKVSKNWMQDMLRASSDWSSSKMAALLTQAGMDAAAVDPRSIETDDVPDASDDHVEEKPAVSEEPKVAETAQPATQPKQVSNEQLEAFLLGN